jgi:hypothetical protein
MVIFVGTIHNRILVSNHELLFFGHSVFFASIGINLVKAFALAFQSPNVYE